MAEFIDNDDNPVNSLDEFQTFVYWHGYAIEGAFREAEKHIPVDPSKAVEAASTAENDIE